MNRRIELVAEAGEVARSAAVYAIAIALGVYVLATNHAASLKAAMAGLVLLILIGATLQIRRAIRQLHREHAQTRKSAAKAEYHYFRVLHRVLAMVENRQAYSTGRSRRVGRLARLIARRMGLPKSQCRLVSLAGRVHDIGLLSVPETILFKRGRLAGGEFRIVQRHPELSCRILQPLSFLADVLPAIRHHHERMNGTGYPHELLAGLIPIEARILAVADSYEAMTHDRPHRSAMTPLQALDELRRCAPAGYDTACVAALEQILNASSLREAARGTGILPVNLARGTGILPVNLARGTGILPVNLARGTGILPVNPPRGTGILAVDLSWHGHLAHASRGRLAPGHQQGCHRQPAVGLAMRKVTQ